MKEVAFLLVRCLYIEEKSVGRYLQSSLAGLTTLVSKDVTVGLVGQQEFLSALGLLSGGGLPSPVVYIISRVEYPCTAVLMLSKIVKSC
jgi:hypothetical protein